MVNHIANRVDNLTRNLERIELLKSRYGDAKDGINSEKLLVGMAVTGMLPEWLPGVRQASGVMGLSLATNKLLELTGVNNPIGAITNPEKREEVVTAFHKSLSSSKEFAGVTRDHIAHAFNRISEQMSSENGGNLMQRYNDFAESKKWLPVIRDYGFIQQHLGQDSVVGTAATRVWENIKGLVEETRLQEKVRAFFPEGVGLSETGTSVSVPMPTAETKQQAPAPEAGATVALR